MTYLGVNHKLNVWELIFFRIGMSIYAGWVTVASILGFAIMLKSFGMSEANGYDETTWAIVILWVAEAVYVFQTVFQRNPLYGSIYLWALLGIRSR